MRKCLSLWSEFHGREDGHVAITFGVALIPIVAGVGAAVDYSHSNHVQSSVQKALDSAVLAAAIDGSSNWRGAATNVFSGNLELKRSTIGSPTFTLEKGVYSGAVSAVAESSFMKLIGIKDIQLRVTAAATTAKIPVCVLGLNSFENGAFDMNGNAKFNAPECAVQANTKSNKGMTQEGKPTAVARKFGVTGAHTGTGYSTPPKDGSEQIADPYANIPFPPYDPCPSKPNGMTINSGSVTLSPGTYCGGVRIKGQVTVKMDPGVYVMVDGSFWIDGGASVTGREVVIAFTGDDATLRLWGNSTLDLTSPVSGTWKNFQFFQNVNDDKGRGAWVSIGGNGNSDDKSKATWDGMAYFPTQNFWVYGNTTVNMNSPGLSLVAGQIWVQGNATMNVTNNNPRNVSINGVTTSGGARLMQ